MSIDEFLEEYFKLIEKVNEFHWEYLTTNKFIFPKNDYFQLKHFIDTAVNFLLDIEPNLFDNLSSKLFNDIQSLYQFYNQFHKKSEYHKLVFYNEFLNQIENYKKLKQEFENTKNKMKKHYSIIEEKESLLNKIDSKDTQYKTIKKDYVDALYYYSKEKENYYALKEEIETIENRYKDEFKNNFIKLRDKNLLKLKKIISTKLFYFDSLLWYRAYQFESIMIFKEKSNIEGELSTKTFIKYFIKNIDIEKSQNSQWYNYLQTILKVID